MQNLYALATKLGVQIEYTDLTHLDRDGDYNARTHTIRLQTGMLYRLERSVLAHELAHAIRKDRPTMFGYYNARDERCADEWAAHALVDPHEYRLAEEKFGSSTEYIAQELCVMDWVIDAYEQTLTKIGNTVYVGAKLGHGNWKAKYEAA